MPMEKILVVDDNPVDARLMKYILSSLGYRITEIVSTAEQAFESVEKIRPDLVLMDIVLPGSQDGISAAEQIRKDMNVPVVFISAHSEEEIVAKAQTVLSYGYLVKPINKRSVGPTIQMALHNHWLHTRLWESRALFQAVVEQASDGICVVDAETGNILEANDQFRKLLGLEKEELNGIRYDDLAHRDPHKVVGDFEELSRNGRRLFGTRVFQKQNGSEIDLEVNGARITSLGKEAYCLVCRDISERRRLELQMVQTKKLESLNLVAQGVAHFFNNKLAVIVGNCSMIMEDLDPRASIFPLVRDIWSAGKKAIDLTEMMISYSGASFYDFLPLNLTDLVFQALKRLPVADGVEVRGPEAPDPDFPLILGDPVRLKRILGHLWNNALEAMENREGTITVVAGQEENAGDPGSDMAFGTVDAGPCVYLELSDDGPGIDPEIIGKIFDPFFSTKFLGRGLGLAEVLGVVRAHGGRTSVRSSPGTGTRFRLVFPVHA